MSSNFWKFIRAQCEIVQKLWSENFKICIRLLGTPEVISSLTYFFVFVCFIYFSLPRSKPCSSQSIMKTKKRNRVLPTTIITHQSTNLRTRPNYATCDEPKKTFKSELQTLETHWAEISTVNFLGTSVAP